MELTINIPDEKLKGLESHILSHGNHVPHPVTQAMEWKQVFPTVDAYFLHVIQEQIEQFNRRYPSDQYLEKVAAIQQLEEGIRTLNRANISVTADKK